MTLTWLQLMNILIIWSSYHGSSIAEDVQSPPLQDHPTSSWGGHLQPLGSAATRFPLTILDHFPSPTEFFRSYVYPSIPVVFRNGAKRSPAFSKWSDDYFKSLPQAQDQIDVEARKVENRSMPARRMSFVEFLDRYEFHDEYLVTGVPEFLKKDVLLPPPLHCDNITANMVDTVIWFSSGGTKSVIHNDDVDNINCLFRGQKEMLFVNYTKYRHQIVFDHPEGSYSSVDVEKVDYNKYPEFRDVEFFEARMEAGDCIYIPYKWIHQVNSFHSNIAVNVWWNHLANIIPTTDTCGSPDPKLSLADVRFSSQQDEVNAGDEKTFQMESDFFEEPLESINKFLGDEKVSSFTEAQFIDLLSVKMSSLQGGVWNEEALDLVHQMFELIDDDHDGQITQRDIETQMSKEDEQFYLLVGQKFVLLIDVIDEVVAKQKAKLQKKLIEESSNLEKNATSPITNEPQSPTDGNQGNQDATVLKDEL